MSQQPVTPPSYLPIFASLAMLVFAMGSVSWIQGKSYGLGVLMLGVGALIIVSAQWFYRVVIDGQTFLANNATFDRSLRIGMMWFIFTEFMFFAGLFGVLFYIRTWALPVLSGQIESKLMTHVLLWPDFIASWPLLQTPDQSLTQVEAIKPFGIPLLNTFILLLSGLTITLSHFMVLKNQLKKSASWLVVTIVLGWLFLALQVYEYHYALVGGLRLGSGIYGSIFYLMTGFHGIHVFIGTLVLMVMWCRMFQGHFSAKEHFGFEAAIWYWHFVDVVWLMLFVFVYWI